MNKSLVLLLLISIVLSGCSAEDNSAKIDSSDGDEIPVINSTIQETSQIPIVTRQLPPQTVQPSIEEKVQTEVIPAPPTINQTQNQTEPTTYYVNIVQGIGIHDIS